MSGGEERRAVILTCERCGCDGGWTRSWGRIEETAEGIVRAEPAHIVAEGWGLPRRPSCSSCSCHSGIGLLPHLRADVLRPESDELLLARAEAESDDWPAAAGMEAVRRAEAAGCSQLALTLVRDAAQAAATGESAEQWRAEVEFEQWVEDELRAAGAWPWGVP